MSERARQAHCRRGATICRFQSVAAPLVRVWQGARWVAFRSLTSAACRLALALIGAQLAAAPALAVIAYSAGIDDSKWYIASSIFECSLTHDIPGYGRGVFYREAGEPLHFYLHTPRNLMRPGEAAMVIEAPPWRPGSRVRDLGYVGVRNTERPVRVEEARASQLMDGLLAGMMPTFTRKALYNEEGVRVGISSVDFRRSYEDYKECVAGLLPVNFRQVERSRIYFRSDESVLTDADRKVLDNVAIFVSADPSVTAVFIDGHTDATGRRLHNRRLSKARAEAVHDYLAGKGIPTEKMTVRYHGERYPVSTNKSPRGKAENRRTTVRLDRGARPEPAVSTEDMFDFEDEETGRALSPDLR